MAKGISNTSRTLEYLRSQGWLADKVEMWNPYSRTRKDFLGFGDVIALGENSIIAVQSCGSAFSAHHKKITEDEAVAPNAVKWLECGGRLLLIGWAKRKRKLDKGWSKAEYWTPRLKWYRVEDFGKGEP